MFIKLHNAENGKEFLLNLNNIIEIVPADPKAARDNEKTIIRVSDGGLLFIRESYSDILSALNSKNEVVYVVSLDEHRSKKAPSVGADALDVLSCGYHYILTYDNNPPLETKYIGWDLEKGFHFHAVDCCAHDIDIFISVEDFASGKATVRSIR